MEGVAPSTPRGRAPRHIAGSVVGPRRVGSPWGASGSPRATGADGAAPSRDGTRPRRGRRQGCTRRVCCRETRGLIEAAYKQVTRRVHRWRASLRRRHGNAHRATPPGRGWPSTRSHTLGCIGFATRNRRRRSGALQGSTRPHRGRLQTGHPQGSPMEGAASTTPKLGCPRTRRRCRFTPNSIHGSAVSIAHSPAALSDSPARGRSSNRACHRLHPSPTSTPRPIRG